MKPLRRRLTFQLTPLLDLLLIVIFAQYMEVQQQTASATDRAAADVAKAESRLSEAAAQLDRLRNAGNQVESGMGELQAQLDELQRDNARLGEKTLQLQQQAVELGQSLEQAEAQRDLVGKLATELFHLPGDLIEQQLLARDPDVLAKSPEQLRELQEKFRALGEQQASEMVKHLLTYEELRKRCDIWDVYIGATGAITFEAGERTLHFRAETAEEFATRLFESYKSLPEPKSLVIILLSYGNAKAVWRKAARDGLREAAGRMRSDSGGQSRFEYAVLGYRPRRPDDGEPPQIP